MSDTPFLDAGQAPEYFASKVHRIDELGPCRRLVFAVERPSSDGSGKFAEPPVTVILPSDALADLVRLIQTSLARKGEEPCVTTLPN
jgi:hypothetical protein